MFDGSVRRSRMSLRAYLLACGSQVVKEPMLQSGLETKKAVEDDGHTCALFEVPALSCQSYSFAHVGGV